MFGKPTWTWNNADYSYRFMKNTYFKAFDSPWMDVGGLIYVDWNGADTDNAKNRAIRAVRWVYESSSATSEPSQRRRRQRTGRRRPHLRTAADRTGLHAAGRRE